MNRARTGSRLRWGIASAGCLVLVLSAAAGAVNRGTAETAEPSIAPPSMQATPTVYPDTGDMLGPLPADFAPKVSGDYAAQLVAKMYPGAKVIAPILGSYTNAQFKNPETGQLLVENLPVWLVDVQGACVPLVSQPDNPDATNASPEMNCNDRHVIVDAMSGSVIEDWS